MARTLNIGYLKKIMKKVGAILALLMLISIGAIANGQAMPEEEKEFKYQKVNNTAFQVGEKLEYKFAYGLINAGTATLEVKKHPSKINNREVLHIDGKGQTNKAFDLFFKVRDSYETYIDEEGIFPWLFVRRIHEGGYEKSQDYKFFQHQGKVKNEDEEVYPVPHGIQDMLSAFYFARTFDFKNLKKGDEFEFESFVDEEIYPLRIRYSGKKTVKIKKGKFDCLVFHPVIQEGRIFKSDEDLTVYITNDENKIPVLAKAKILVGSLRMELIDYQNLANPVAKR